MKVKEIIKLLNEYNPEAEFGIITENKKQNFNITYGSSEGVTKLNCEEVNLYIDKMNNNEN